ncbi:alpha/beta hydrolase domain-containing protein [soil metagenome]
MQQVEPRRRRRVVAAVAVAVTLLVAAACSSSEGGSSGDGGSKSEGTSVTSTTKGSAGEESAGSTDEAATGPVSSFAPLTGGNGVRLVSASPGAALADAGYEELEYSASGSAVAYAADELPTNGEWTLTPTDTPADYATRVVVRRPTDPKDFSGNVVVEWLNVSSGADAAPDYTYLADELLRQGDSWVGVSAQLIGIEGGESAVAIEAGNGIKNDDPARYGLLHHPGDAYSYDIYTQVARGLRASNPDNPLDGFDVDQVLAIGESQSAFALTTYANGVQPISHEFDGFLIHSRGGAAAPLGTPGTGIDIAGTIGGEPTTVRTDLDVPTIIVETETDVLGLLGYYPARQPDTDMIRVWEVAGAAHADKAQVGAAADMFACPTPVNDGQQMYVLRTALHDLTSWAAGGDAPPKAAPLETTGDGSSAVYVLDAVGNVAGGVRTPVVDAPVELLSGLPADGASVICILFGQTNPIPPDTLAGMYPSRDAYIAAYTEATDAAIDAGFILEADREAVLADARPDRLPA